MSDHYMLQCERVFLTVIGLVVRSGLLMLAGLMYRITPDDLGRSPYA